MRPIQEYDEALRGVGMALVSFEDTLWHMVASAMRLSELSEAEWKDLCFALHFDCGRPKDWVFYFISHCKGAQSLYGELEGEILRRQVEAYKAMPYWEYIKTAHWQAIRAQAVERDGNRCRVCNSPDNLNVHHRSYERLGQELPDDLTTLCQSCHEMFHTNGKLKRPEIVF